ncbi:MAG: SDR family oxidoreductase [Acidimicrobiales bacterium]
MSTVLVTGGSGTLGQKLVARLRAGGEDVRVLSRRAGRGTHLGDLSSGAGVVEAAADAELVVHAASDTRRFGRADLEQTKHLLRAVSSARHVLYVSIVGIDQIPYAYYRRKLACERLFEASDVPYTIARATQFHELIAMVLRFAERLPVAPLPLDFRFQPVAADDVAGHMVHLLGAEPLGRARDFGGPEVLSLAEMVDGWRQVRGRPRAAFRIPLRGRVADGFREGRSVCPDGVKGSHTWQDFVRGLTVS